MISFFESSILMTDILRITLFASSNASGLALYSETLCMHVSELEHTGCILFALVWDSLSKYISIS